MNIATALNKKYIRYTVVMLLSICENNSEHVDAYLFNSELEERNIADIRSALEKYDISIHPVMVDRNRFNDRLPRTSQWSIEMYYRLMMTELIPKEVDRLLYLDVDLIVDGALDSFYLSDFENREMIVLDDKGGNNVPSSYGEKHQEMFKEAYQNGHRYFNSGVMLVNLEIMRKKYSFQTYLDAIEVWNYEMKAPDQDILNWVHWRNVKFDDYKKYDYFARVAHNDGVSYEEAKRDITIIHYAGNKPWEYRNFHYDLEKLWWDYAKKSPYYWDLLEAFIEMAMCDTTVEKYLNEITEINGILTDSLTKMMGSIKNHLGK